MGTISKAKVISIREYSPVIREYTFQLAKNNYFEAGSFLLLTLEDKDDYTRWPESRNFSIASAYEEDGVIKVVIQKVGKYTTRIFDELTLGSSCTVKYAYGDFLLPFFEKDSPICCIVGGTGIAPILSFCEQLKKMNQLERLHVYYSFKTNEEHIGIEVLSSTVPSNQLHLFCTRQALMGIPNRRIEMTDILESGIDMQNSSFYICGNENFNTYFANCLKNINTTNIYTDEW